MFDSKPFICHLIKEPHPYDVMIFFALYYPIRFKMLSNTIKLSIDYTCVVNAMKDVYFSN